MFQNASTHNVHVYIKQ